MEASAADNVPASWSVAVSDLPAGASAKFAIRSRDRVLDGFVVNVAGAYYAYINYCPHAGTPLDWWPNEFFGRNKLELVCGTHGSRFDPRTGRCTGGPCAGAGLFPLQVRIAAERVVVSAPQTPLVH